MYKALALILLGLLVYLPGLPGGFIFDDYHNIVDNPAMRPAEWNSEALVRAALSSPSGPLRRPVSSLSFLLNYEVFGAGAFSFKLFNLILHLANACLLYLLGRALLTRLTAMTRASCDSVALLAAAMWVVHPLNLTSVLYVVQRMNSLAAFFCLISMFAYMKIRERAVLPGATVPWALWGVLISSGVLALGSKENAVLLPLALLLIETTCFRFRSAPKLKWGYWVVLLLGVAGVMFLVLEREILTRGYAHRPFTAWERGATELRVLAYYLKQILLPDPFSMALLHADFTVSRGLFSPPTTFLALLLHAALLGFACWYRSRYRLFCFSVAWFYLWHLLESTIFPLELLYEHRNYLATTGPLLLISTLLLHIPRVTPRVLVLTGIGVVLILGSMTFYRAWRWSDPVTLALLERQHNPKSERAAYEYARVLLNAYTVNRRADLLREAREVMRPLASSDSPAPLVLVGLINSYLVANEPVPQRWVKRFAAHLDQGDPDSGDINALEMLVTCQTPPGPCLPAPDVILQPIGAILDNEAASPATKALVLEKLAIYYANSLGDLPAARRATEGACSYMPEEALYLLRLAEIQLASGQTDLARVTFSNADALAARSSGRLRPLWLARRATLLRKFVSAMQKESVRS